MSDNKVFEDQMKALDYFEIIHPISDALWDSYQEMKRDSGFLTKFKLFNNFSPRRENVFSLWFDTVPWSKRRLSEDESSKFIREFFDKLKTKSDILSRNAELKLSFSKRVIAPGEHPFHFVEGHGGTTYLPLWFLVGETYRLPIDEMIDETKAILSSWLEVTEKWDICTSASVAFGNIVTMEKPRPLGRMQMGQAFTDSARLPFALIKKNQKSLSVFDSSIVTCNKYASWLLFGCLIGSEYKDEETGYPLRIALNGDLQLNSSGDVLWKPKR